MLVPFRDILGKLRKASRKTPRAVNDVVLRGVLGTWLKNLPPELQKTVGEPTVISSEKNTMTVSVAQEASLPDLLFYRANLEEALAKNVLSGQRIRVSFQHRSA